jgi:hypothetical protein
MPIQDLKDPRPPSAPNRSPYDSTLLEHDEGATNSQDSPCAEKDSLLLALLRALSAWTT